MAKPLAVLAMALLAILVVANTESSRPVELLDDSDDPDGAAVEDRLESSAVENITVVNEEVNTSVVPVTKEQSDLGPQIVGGSQGTLEFASAATTQSEALLTSNASNVYELGEAEIAVVDKKNSVLFDLVPLFQGLQADRVRQRAIVGRCAPNVNELVTSSICKPTNSTATDGACTELAMPAMSQAMQTLWKNAQTVFCKHSPQCEASLCYKYPGPVDSTGLASGAPYEVFSNQPIWINHNQTIVENATAFVEAMIVQQYVSFDIALEKIVFCESLTPARPTTAGYSQARDCHTSRKCTMKKLVRAHCVNPTSAESPAPVIPCPTDLDYITKLKVAELELTAVLCSQA